MANILEDDTVLDARNDAMTFRPPWGHVPAGVRLRPPGYLQASNRKWAIYEFGAPAMYVPWRDALLSQLGKPYDQAGIWAFVRGFLTGRHTDRNYNRADPSRSRAWFCDALAIFGANACHYFDLPANYSPYDQTPGAALNLWIGAGARLVAARG